jgi:hypothetical protein
MRSMDISWLNQLMLMITLIATDDTSSKKWPRADRFGAVDASPPDQVRAHADLEVVESAFDHLQPSISVVAIGHQALIPFLEARIGFGQVGVNLFAAFQQASRTGCGNACKSAPLDTKRFSACGLT